MKKLLALSLAGACSAVGAQTPANNPMPDGSRDLYIGLGALAVPHYEGARGHRVRAMPLVQFEWSNGVFLSGMSAGIHLAPQGAFEYGPLLAWHARRDQDGDGGALGGVTQQSLPGRLQHQGGLGPMSTLADGLAGMDTINGRLQAGVFANAYLSPTLRLTNSVLYGAGKWHDGLLWNVAVQHTAAEITARHRLSWSAGATLANNSYNTSYSGVSAAESVSSGHRPYSAGGGLRDVYLGAGWNWALSPEWMLTSSARVTRLQGDARNSPLVQRPTNVLLCTGLAYRF
jgi:outer membrane protein